jgi:hypothetical protein
MLAKLIFDCLACARCSPNLFFDSLACARYSPNLFFDSLACARYSPNEKGDGDNQHLFEGKDQDDKRYVFVFERDLNETNIKTD